MARYFFDIHCESLFTRDVIGLDCSSHEEIRREAMGALPAIARDVIAKDRDWQAFMMLVRDESNITVYMATLTFAGSWIGDTPIPTCEGDPLQSN